MTAVTDEPRTMRCRRAALPLAASGIAALSVTVATLLTLATMWPIAHAVLAGTFTDPDDAMRLVEVRAWMAGQSWFDVSALRLDPPGGASMHWSRLVDVPNATLIRLFAHVTPNAEAWDRIVLPTLLLGVLYAGFARLASVLVAGGARGPALVGLFLTGVTLVQFQPGRIGHHAPETTALVWAIACALASLDAGRAWQAAAAGGLVALSLAMSLETLPFVGALCGAMLALWIRAGAAMAQPLRAFSLGLGLAAPALFVATVPPVDWSAPVCDAIGGAHVGAAMIFSAGGLALAALSTALSWPRRFMSAAALGVVVLVFVALAFPACRHGPFAGVDPLVREIWLDHVVESKPLLVFLRERPDVGFSIVLPMVLGLLCALCATFTLRGRAAQRFAVIAGLSGLGLGLAFWQVRVLATVAPLALYGGVFAVSVLRDRLASRGVRASGLFAAFAILPFTATAWAIALPTGAEVTSRGPSCLASTALAPLARLPAGSLVAPVDAGSHLLEATPHDVFAAPYHRNNDGNRFALDVFLAAPAEADALLASRHVAYLATCPGLGETERLAARAPDSIAAKLQAGVVPAFLRLVPLTGTPYRVYAVRTATP